MNVLITGASRGIGYQTALLFAKNPGNNVFVLSRSRDKLNRLREESISRYRSERIIPVVIDLTEIHEKREALLQKFGPHGGKLDILINNAGSVLNKPFEDTDCDEVNHIFQVNYLGAACLIQVCLTLLQCSERAHILNISSMGGFQGSVKFPGLSHYSASKGALAILTECLAEEYKESNMRFNCLALGAVQTEMLSEAFPGYQAPMRAEEMAVFLHDFALNGWKYFNGKILPVSVSTP